MNRTTSRSTWIATIFSFVFLCTSNAFSFVADDFDSYSLGDIHGQGFWEDFDPFNTFKGQVTDEMSFSGSNSLKLMLDPADTFGSDVFLNLPTVASGKWSLSYMVYVPSTFEGAALTYLSEFHIDDNAFGSYGRYIVQDNEPTFEGFYVSHDGAVESNTPAGIVTDQWSHVEAIIDLDANTADVMYDGDMIYSGVWDDDPAGGAAGPTIGTLNLWVQGFQTSSSGVFFDDFSVTAVPEPGSIALVSIGVFSLLARRRKR